MELTKNKDLLQIVINAASNGIVIMQPLYNEKESVDDFIVLLLNTQAIKWIGNANYKGKKYSDIFNNINDKKILNDLIEVAETSSAQIFEHLYESNNSRYCLRFNAAMKDNLLVVTTEDITDRNFVETALAKASQITEKQQRLYESVTNNTPDLVYVFDLNYKFTYANKALLSMWGKPAEEAIGKGLRENGYEEWHALMHEREIDEVVATKKSIRGTVSFPHAELGKRIYDYIFAPVFNEKGEVEAIAGTTRDITDLEKAQEQLYQSEYRFRNMIEHAPVAACLFVGRELKIEIANDIMIGYWGKGASVIGKTLAVALPELEGQPFLKQLDDIFTTGKSISSKAAPARLVVNGKPGIYYFDYTYKPLLNEKGEVYAIMDMAVDVTEEVLAKKAIEASEARFRSMIEQSPVAMSTSTGIDCVVEVANERMYEIWGRRPEEILGKPVFEALPEARGQGFEEIIEQMFATGETFRANGVPITLVRNGKEESIYLNLVYQPQHDNEQKIIGITQVAIDVTEQFLSRKKLEESEARLKSVIEQTPAPMLVLLGDKLVIEQVNKFMLQLIGRGEEIIGMPLIEVLPELRGQYVWEQVQKVYWQGVAFDQWEVKVPHNRTGVIMDYYYNLSYRPLKEDGKIIGMVQVAIDVTEHVLARKKVEESESRFRNLIRDASTAIVVLTGNEMNVEIANKAYARLIDLEPEDLLNKSLFNLIPEAEAYYRPLLEGVYKTGKPVYLYDSPYAVNTNGKLIKGFLNVVYQPYKDTDGNIMGVMAILQDVTTQVEASQKIQESEEKFRQLADMIPQIIWTGRDDGYIDYYNKGWYDYTGFEIKEFGDESWLPIMHPEDVPLTMQNWYGSVKAGTPFQLEFRLRNGSTGEYRWFLSKGLPIYDKEGNIAKWFGTSTDIHEQKTITEKLEMLVTERTKELQRSNQDLQQFAHVASHDLKEPVRKIKTFLSRLEEHLNGSLDDQSKKYMERINVSTNRMFTMIDGVLAYSTMNASKQQPQPVDLNDVIMHIENDLELMLQNTGATIACKELPTIEGAPVLLYQLFYNLINNSIKFAKTNVPSKINISSQIIYENNTSFARIALQDNGIGFEPDEVDVIFNTFTRLNSKDKYEGTGLGLSLCKKIVERHGGNISATGNPDEGATFIIKLPLKQEKESV